MKIKIILFVLPFLLLSCTQDKYTDTYDNLKTLSIQEAKQWYDSQLTSTNLNLPQKVKNDSIIFKLKPFLNWEKAKLANDSLWSVVELPWEYSNGELNIAESDVKQYLETYNTQTRQILKLVIMQNRKSGETYGFRMAIIPDLEYMLKIKDGIDVNSYLYRDNELDGLVIFYTLSGNEFVNGWKYTKGKITGKLGMMGETTNYVNVKPNSIFKSSALPVQYIEVETCGWYESGGNIGVDCYTTIYVVYADDATTIGGGVDTGGYDYTGGTTGGGGTTNTEETTAKKGDLPDKKPKNEDIKTDCKSAIQAIKDLIASNFTYLSQYAGYRSGGVILPSYTDFLNAISFQSNQEHSMTLQYEQYSGYYTTQVTLAGYNSNVYIYTNDNSVASIHNHPNTTPPSPQDLKTLLDIAYGNANYHSLYTLTSNGTVYALEVTDRGKLTNFWKTYSSSMTIDPATNSFTEKTEFYDNWDNAQKNFAKLGETTAWEYAIAYLLAKYDMGVSFSKMASSDSGFTMQYLQKNETTGKFELMQCK